MEQLQANFKLAVYIFTLITILLVIIIVYLVASVDELEKQIEDIREIAQDDSRQENPYECESIPLEEINDLKDDYEALKGMVEEQQKQIEDMVLSYKSLDEILTHMGIKAQERYKKKVGE